MARGTVRLAIALVFQLVAARLLADDLYTIKQAIFLPPTYYVGDQVELRLTIEVADGIIPTEPSVLPSPGWVVINKVTIIPASGQYDVRILFTSFYPGTRTLPTIDLGKVKLAGIKIFTTPIVSSASADLAPAMDPVLLPGTRLLIAILVGVLLLGPFIVIWLVRFGRRLSRSIRAWLTSRLPYRRLSRSLDSLAAADPPPSSRDFYNELMRVLREYLAARLSLPVRASTTGEVSAELEESLADPDLRMQVSYMMQQYDVVRFGGKPASQAHRDRYLDELRQTAGRIESVLAEQAQKHAEEEQTRVGA